MQPRTGFKASEFYLTLLNSAVGMLVLLGYITPEQADQVTKAIIAVTGGLMVLISTGLYIYARFKLKQTGLLVSKATSQLPTAKGAPSSPTGAATGPTLG